MELTEILHPDCVCVPLQAKEKQQAIYELVDLLAGHLNLERTDELKEAVWERETTRTTGIGHGVAIPHGKCGGCQQLAMAVGMADPPLDFGAIDGQPVNLIFLVVSPEDETGPHIEALAAISRLLTNPDVRAELQQAQSPDDLYERIQAANPQ